MIIGIQSGEVDSWWEHAEPYISKALKYSVGEYLPEDIKDACKERDMQLWVMWDKGVEGVFVTHILIYPQLKILLGLLISSDNFKIWRKEVDEILIGFGKEHNCKYLEFFGRKGWGNYLKDINYKEQSRMFTKEIV